MERTDTAQQVWIFVKENDQWHHRPLFLAILDLLRREGVAGATVLRGLAGFGARGHIHTATLVELGSELPVVIIFVDRADRVERVMPQLAAMVQVGLISNGSFGRSPARATTRGKSRPDRVPGRSAAPRR